MRRTVPWFAPPQHADGLIDRVRNIVQVTRDRVRTHVLSRELCDESLRRLQPTLPAPGTCDIVDINPGVCVWSEAVHDVLKPRRHVLVESNRNAYADFFEPLLNKPASAFRYAPDLSVAMSPKSGLLSSEIIDPFVKARNKGQMSRRGEAIENKSLLIIANLTRSSQAPGFSGTEAKRFLSNYYRSMFNSAEYIHRYGLVRILAWIDDSSRKAILPSSISGQTKQSLQLEAAFDITAVAGPDEYRTQPSQTRRWYSINEENAQDVERIQAKSGAQIPTYRRVGMPQRPMQTYIPNTEFLAKNRSLFPESQKFIDDLLDVESTLADQNPDWLHSISTRFQRGELKRGKPVDGTLFNKTAEQKLYRRLLNQLQTYFNNFSKITSIIAEHRSLWQQIKSLANPQDEIEKTKLESLLDQYENLEQRTKDLKRENRVIVYKAVDDYRAYDSTPRAMSWNRRTAEPLLVKPDEFYPRHSLTLVDLTPRLSFLDRLDTVDKVICFDYLVTSLNMYRSDSVMQAVQRLVGAGAEEFLRGMPEFYNIEQGGWHDLESLRLRSLHCDFYVRLAELFVQWPHRPPLERLITQSGGVFDRQI